MSLVTSSTEDWKRWGSAARLLWRFGRREWLADSPLEEAQAGGSDEGDGGPEELVSELEALGPTYVKLGQLLSTRADLLPPEYIEALERLQSGVAPFETAEVERIVSEEIGMTVSEAYSEFDPEPLASASIGQVHTAKLRSGRSVVVKVQRPGVAEQIQQDLHALAGLAGFLDQHTDVGRRIGFASLLANMRRSLLRELDYREEARNLERLGRAVSEYDHIIVPSPVWKLTTQRVLTMDRVHGRKATELTPLALLEIDGPTLASELFGSYLDQMLVHGFFHADPHPGNVLITEDDCIALIDLGMVGQLSELQRERLLSALIALGDGRGTEVANSLVDLGEPLEDWDEPAFQAEISEIANSLQGASLLQTNVGQLLADFLRAATRHGLRPSPDLLLASKALLNVDAVALVLDRDFVPQEALKERTTRIARNASLQRLSPRHALDALLRTRQLIEALPRRVDAFTKALADNEIRVKVDAIDEERLLGGLQKIANRIAVGAVLAASILAGALMMRLESGPMWFGHPAIGLVVLGLSVFGAAVLVVTSLAADFLERRRRRGG